MLAAEVYKLPKILTVGSYIIYFWSNENNEPVHVHIAEKIPNEYATKIWLTKTGRAIVAHNIHAETVLLSRKMTDYFI